MATTRELDDAVEYIKKLKTWLKNQQQPFNKKIATKVNRLNRKVFKKKGSRGGPTGTTPPPTNPPFKP